MYKWKNAKRSETNNLFTDLLFEQVEKKADHVQWLGEDRFGQWLKIKLPAGVVALMVVSPDDDVTVGYYHVEYEADLEYKDRSKRAIKQTAQAR